MRNIDIFIVDRLDPNKGLTSDLFDLTNSEETVRDSVTDHVMHLAKVTHGLTGSRKLVVCSKRISEFVKIDRPNLRILYWLPSIFKNEWRKLSEEKVEVNFHLKN